MYLSNDFVFVANLLDLLISIFHRSLSYARTMFNLLHTVSIKHLIIKSFIFNESWYNLWSPWVSVHLIFILTWLYPYQLSFPDTVINVCMFFTQRLHNAPSIQNKPFCVITDYFSMIGKASNFQIKNIQHYYRFPLLCMSTSIFKTPLRKTNNENKSSLKWPSFFSLLRASPLLIVGS